MTVGAQSTAGGAGSTQQSAASVTDTRGAATQPSRPATRSRTTAEVAASTGFHPDLIHAILCDEEQRGHVERLEDGRWTLTASARETLAPLRGFDLIGGRG